MKIFVGSSNESSAIAADIADWLRSQGLIPVLWDQPDTFLPGDTILPRLLKIADEVDAAILIFGEDDRVDVRGQPRLQARDNVLIEFGLFVGKMGPERAIGCVVGEANQLLDEAFNALDDIYRAFVRNPDSDLRFRAQTRPGNMRYQQPVELGETMRRRPRS